MLTNELKRVLADRKQQAEASLLERRDEVLRVNPDFLKLEAAVQQAGIRLVQSQLGEQAEQEAAEDAFAVAKEAYERAVKRAGFLVEEMQVVPLCTRCNDTGYLDDARLCPCIQKALKQVTPPELDFSPPPEANLFKVNFHLFTREKRPEWYQGQASPYQAAMSLYRHAKTYVETFTDKSSNLYFYGKPGTGKTYLLAAIGNALKQQGFDIAYLTADRFFSLMSQKRFLERSFRPDPVALDLNQRQTTILKEAPLLILDDLGIESVTDENYRELFHLLDSRARSGYPILIGSNISPAEFKEVYDERISSRLVGHFHLIEVMGPDLRVRLAQIRSQKANEGDTR